MNTRMKWMALAVILMSAMMTGCKNNTQQPVSGTMEKAVAVDGAPQAVADLMKNVVIGFLLGALLMIAFITVQVMMNDSVSEGVCQN